MIRWREQFRNNFHPEKISGLRFLVVSVQLFRERGPAVPDVEPLPVPETEPAEAGGRTGGEDGGILPADSLLQTS